MIGSSLRDENLPPSDCDSEPEEEIISDNDDDDCNHKHRRRGTQSMERDSVDQVLFRPDRKRNKPSANRYTSKENNFQSNKTWKGEYTFSSFARAPNRDNQSFSDELGPGRSREKELSPCIPSDPWLSSVDIASRMVPPGSVLPNIFAKREFPGISNSHGHSWSAYGLMPRVLNEGLDSFHLPGSQRVMRPTISSPQNFMRQRCRDFEESGFCLRGDRCPMDHGVNRIVVEDVQSLSQFNLPVSHPSGNPMTSSSALPSIGTSSSTMMTSNSRHRRNEKPEITDGGLSNVVSSFSSSADGADLYDPDQPLCVYNCPKSSTTSQRLSPLSNFDKTRLFDTRIEHCDKSNVTAVGFQSRSSATLENVGLMCDNSDLKERFDIIVGSSHSIPNNAKQGQGLSANLEHATSDGKIGSQGVDLSPKTQDATRSKIRNHTKKALRTLFVSCIPRTDNKLEAILSHFKRFGEVIDIYIPPNGHRAFVQFSTREEAEGALKAPDAVMGNRFIKLTWANRDKITEDVPSCANGVSLTPRAVPAHQAPPHQSASQKGKGELQPAALLKSYFPNATVSPIDYPKPVVPNLSKAPSPSQKKPVISAILTEFRKRQESFAQKRDALQLELAKMMKKAAGSKGGEIASEQIAKRQKVGSVADTAKAEGPNSCGSGSKMAPSLAEGSDQNIIVDQNSLKPLKEMELHEPPSLKKSVRPLAPAGAPFGSNRFKLDNCRVAFRILPPLPSGLENIDVLKEHFSSYGELSSLELEDENSSDSAAPNNCSALIRFTTRRSAERAFVYGKCWQEHTLQFIWVAYSNSRNDDSKKEKPSSASEVSTTVSAESGNFGIKNSIRERVQKREDLRSSSSSVSGDS